MHTLFADLLPDDILVRRTKATFSSPYWRKRTRAFASSWDGTGVDPTLVDVDVLRRYWARDRSPPAPTFVVLKAVWLAANGETALSTEVGEEARAALAQILPAAAAT